MSNYARKPSNLPRARGHVLASGYAYGSLRIARPLPAEAAISDRLTGATLRRAILRAVEAGELTIVEIAAEFGCTRGYVNLTISEAQRDHDSTED